MKNELLNEVFTKFLTRFARSADEVLPRIALILSAVVMFLNVGTSHFWATFIMYVTVLGSYILDGHMR